MIELAELPLEIRRAEDSEPAESIQKLFRRSSHSDIKAECSMIKQALADASGVRTQAAKILGISRTTLWRKMKAHSLD
jgi:transcriptional regulator of acetoin/glycerol metabolism